VLITAVHKRSKGRYGARRIHAELRRQGHRHSRKRVAQLMRQHGLRGRAPKRWKKTTIPDPAAAARADAIRRDFTADAATINQRWCGDYLSYWLGWAIWPHMAVGSGLEDLDVGTAAVRR
jgi:putative transposase